MEDILVVIGDTGMLGREIREEAERRGLGVLGFDETNCDVSNFRVPEVGEDERIIGAVYTAVIHDPSTSDANTFFEVNALAPGRIAERFARWNGKPFHYISTDYVFSSGLNGQYVGERSMMFHPFSAYGASKALGECLVMQADYNRSETYIYRCAHMFGKSPCLGKGKPNIIEQMVNGARAGAECKWTETPSSITYASDAARLVVHNCINAYHRVVRPFGRIVHTVQTGEYSLRNVASFVYSSIGADDSLVHDGGQANAPALEPLHMMLSWEQAVDTYLKEMGHV